MAGQMCGRSVWCCSRALSGALPHEAPNYNALMVRILTQDCPSIATAKPDLPASVVKIVDTCLQRERDKRPTAGQLSSMLEAGVRELRASRFRRSGGRRRDDLPTPTYAGPANNASPLNTIQPPPTDPNLTMKLLAVGASGFMTGSVVGVIVGYWLFGG